MDTKPLLEMLYRQFDDAVLAAVAAEHRKGRRLYVGTTDLDAEALTAWDMGAIAASGRPNARETFCRVLLASASIPGAFPPVTFEAEAEGRRFDELHADGGVQTLVFGFGPLGKLKVGTRMVARTGMPNQQMCSAYRPALAMSATAPTTMAIIRTKSVILIQLYGRSPAIAPVLPLTSTW